MKNRHLTIKDIARELNISPSTVSRALRNHHDISQATKDKVNEFAHAHNYQPNALALSLRTSHTNIVGIIIPQITHFFFASVINGMEKVAEENDYSIIICQSHEDYEKEVRSVRTLMSTRVCGILASLAKTTQNYDHFQEVIDSDVPIVFFDRICTGLLTDRVVVDDYTGAFNAVDHLIRTGCKRIAFYSAPLHLEISKNRKNGYLDALRKNKIAVDESLIIICDTQEEALERTPHLLQKENRPDAFFAINDATASGILTAVKRNGLKVPDEISICGFSDGFVARNTDPKLTTVDQQGVEVGINAMELLLNRLRNNDENHRIASRIIKTKLLVRESTR
ncbi:MAG: LacI family DNA-binding transcriptional regulator [Bacteroidales bacterium]